MTFRLVAFTAMFADDAKKVVNPFIATRKLRESFSTPWVHIQGLGQYVSPFGNRDIQLNKLVRDVEDGRVFLLDDSNGFGTMTACVRGSDGFCSKVNAVKSSGKQRLMSGVSYEVLEDIFKVDEYTSEPIVPDEPAEQQERTEFLCGWSESQKGQSKADAIVALLPSKYQQDKRSFIDRHNDHLKGYVREGEIIVLPTREPKTDEELAELNELKAEAQKVSTSLHSVSEEEAQIAVRFFPLMDYVVSKDGYSDSLAAYGTILAGVEAHLKSVEKTFKSIHELFCNEVVSIGSRKYLSSAFYSERAKLFKQLDSALHRMTFNCVGIPIYKKLKKTLGLSVKSIVYHGKDILDANGVIKGFSERLGAIGKWLKGTKRLGVFGVVLDSLGSIPVIAEAFTSEEGKPIKAISVQAARVGGGFYGGNLGAAAATIVIGKAAALISASAAAVTVGPFVLGVAVLAGAAVGAYYGAKYGSKFFSFLADKAYDLIEDVVEFGEAHGGFFDWNTEQI